jgi:Zn-dependent protease with chaperone function
MYKLVSPLIFFFILGFVRAQTINDYSPVAENKENKTKIISSVNNRYQSDINQLPKQYKNETEEIYKTRFESLTTSLKEDKYFFDSSFNLYLNEIFKIISKNNPEIPVRDLRILVSRETIPNAVCFGEGTIAVNIGLLRRMENESQIAFVICHELAHYTLNHVNRAIEQHIKFLNSKETQKEIKSINNSEYNKTTRAIQLIKSLAYSNSRHSRYSEAAADSLAYIYLRKTPYDEQQSITCLKILDTIDKEKYPASFDFKKLISSENIAFKESWLGSNESKMAFAKKEDKEWIADSLKTHPDCQKRILLLQRLLPSTTEKKKFIQSEEAFNKLVILADFEVVESEYFFKRYDKCMYRTLGLLHTYPDNAYLVSMFGKCMYLLYESEKAHELNKYVEMPASGMEPSYKQVLNFILNLRLQEKSDVVYYFLKARSDKFSKKEDFIYASYLACKMKSDATEAKKWSNIYNQKFPNGKYITLLK